MLPAVASDFGGRTCELNNLSLHVKEKKILIIAGLAGIGKTALAIAFANFLAQNTSSRSPIIWVSCAHEWTDGAFLAELAQKFNETTGKKDFVFPESNPDEIVQAMEKHGIILFLDNAHVIDEQLISKVIRLGLTFFNKARLILTTRERIKIDPLEFAEIFETRLKGLSKKSTFSFIEKVMKSHNIHNFSIKYREQIHQKTRGHPFSMKLLVSLMAMGGYSFESLLDNSTVFNDWLADKLLNELWNSLSLKEQQVIKFLAAIRIPVRAEEFFPAKEKKLSAAMQSLINKFILEYDSQGMTRVHDLIRDYAQRKTEWNEKKKINLAISEHFTSREKYDVQEILESYFLMFEIEELEKATDILLSVNEIILHLKEKIENVYHLVNECLKKGSGYRQQELLKFKITLLLYFNYIELAEQEIPEIANKFERDIYIGFLRFKQYKFKEAANLLTRNFDKIDSMEERIKACQVMICCYDIMGNAAKARQYHDYFENKLLEYCSPLRKANFLSVACSHVESIKTDYVQRLQKYEEVESIFEKYGISTITMGRAHCYMMLSDLDNAEQYVRKALKLSKEKRSFYTECVCYDYLGRISMEREEFAQAQKKLAKALEFARKRGSWYFEGIFLFSLAELFVRMGKLDKAEAKFKQVLKLTDKYHDECEKNRFYQGYAVLLLLTGRVEKAQEYLKTIMAFAKRNKDPLFSVVTSFYMAKSMQLSGNHSQYRKSWRKHESLMKKLPNAENLCIQKEFERFEEAISLPASTGIIAIRRNNEVISDTTDNKLVQAFSRKNEYELFVDLVNNILLVEGRIINLFNKKILHDLFLEFCKHPGQNLDVESVFMRIWNRPYDCETDYFTLRTNIYRLRKLLDCNKPERFIRTCANENSYYLDSDIDFCIILKTDQRQVD